MNFVGKYTTENVVVSMKQKLLDYVIENKLLDGNPEIIVTVQRSRIPKPNPPIPEMITTAIEKLKDPKGSSFYAIKKYIAAKYKVDMDRLKPFIKKFLKAAVSTGKIIQIKGKGASGSFKLPFTKSKVVKKPKKRKRLFTRRKKTSNKSVNEKVTVADNSKKSKALTKKAKSTKNLKDKVNFKTKAANNIAKKKVTKKATQQKTVSKDKKIKKTPINKTRTNKSEKAKKDVT
ncbi:hypothetical protein V1478_013251 [Vespula squamosa]|uniref:H15 domain-containing protein n=1 Tax=Vespula squamosa TaxID=30214 RepID=A0ABD2AAA1_VESSQ